ncbi:MAG: nucleotidyltransferase domain-containing protein [Spirochaetes bacterium]|nr:nucleotidyltransferase domain-containing protein [Spirochaetota bacterium]
MFKALLKFKKSRNGWEQIRKEIEEEFVQLAKECFGPDLYAILLYGSAARGMYREGVSDINLLILYRKATHDQLAQFGKKVGSMIRKRRITPLLMSREEFLHSADVFPLEYIDIRNAHRVLFGPDDTASLDLTLKNLRHQTEERLRGSLNQLRQILVASEGKTKLLANYLRSWSGISNALFRALILLRGKDSHSMDPEQLIHSLEREYRLPKGVFSAFERFRRGETRDPMELAGNLLKSLELLTRVVDSLPEEPLEEAV